jgi:hypothetical protein
MAGHFDGGPESRKTGADDYDVLFEDHFFFYPMAPEWVNPTGKQMESSLYFGTALPLSGDPFQPPAQDSDSFLQKPTFPPALYA